MYTIVAILLFFLIVIFSTLLYFKSKKSNLQLLQEGTCPSCLSSTKTFTDSKTGDILKKEVIESKLLKKHGCSGTADTQYSCLNCGYKEIHTTSGYNCSL